jgi:hypothetical protein
MRRKGDHVTHCSLLTDAPLTPHSLTGVVNQLSSVDCAPLRGEGGIVPGMPRHHDQVFLPSDDVVGSGDIVAAAVAAGWAD